MECFANNKQKIPWAILPINGLITLNCLYQIPGGRNRKSLKLNLLPTFLNGLEPSFLNSKVSQNPNIGFYRHLNKIESEHSTNTNLEVLNSNLEDLNSLSKFEFESLKDTHKISLPTVLKDYVQKDEKFYKNIAKFHKGYIYAF